MKQKPLPLNDEQINQIERLFEALVPKDMIEIAYHPEGVFDATNEKWKIEGYLPHASNCKVRSVGSSLKNALLAYQTAYLKDVDYIAKQFKEREREITKMTKDLEDEKKIAQTWSNNFKIGAFPDLIDAHPGHFDGVSERPYAFKVKGDKFKNAKLSNT